MHGWNSATVSQRLVRQENNKKVWPASRHSDCIDCDSVCMYECKYVCRHVWIAIDAQLYV